MIKITSSRTQTAKSYFVMTPEEKEKIVSRAAKEASEMKKELIRKYNKTPSLAQDKPQANTK